MNISQITLYSPTRTHTATKKKDGSEMFDAAILTLIGIGLSSLFIAFIEYAYQRKKRTKTEAV